MEQDSGEQKLERHPFLHLQTPNCRPLELLVNTVGVLNAVLNRLICSLKCGPKCCHLLPYLVLVAASICFIWSLKCCPKCFHLVP